MHTVNPQFSANGNRRGQVTRRPRWSSPALYTPRNLLILQQNPPGRSATTRGANVLAIGPLASSQGHSTTENLETVSMFRASHRKLEPGSSFPKPRHRVYVFGSAKTPPGNAAHDGTPLSRGGPQRAWRWISPPQVYRTTSQPTPVSPFPGHPGAITPLPRTSAR